MQKITFPLAVGVSLWLAVSTVQAETQVLDSFSRDDLDQQPVSQDHSRPTDSRSDIGIDNSRRTTEQHRQALMRQYLLDQQYRSSEQQLDQPRAYSSGAYSSGAGQGAANRGQARGHQLGQQQGGVSVGSLVTAQQSDNSNSQGGFNWQYAPQSNTLMVEGDNNAPIQLSNINANGGNVHIGDVNKGNLYNSQIGNNQHGSQTGSSANVQSNDQAQRADSRVGSSDRVSN